MDMATAPARTERHRRWRRVGQVLLGILAVLIGLYIFQYVTKGRFWRGTFERYASERAGRPVRVAGDFQAYLGPDIHFLAEGLTIGNPAWAARDQLFTARSLAFDAPILTAIFGDLTLSRFVMDGGRIALERDARGRNTWSFPGGGDLEIPVIDRAAITDTRLEFIDALKRARIALTFGDIAGKSDKAGQRVDGPLTFSGRGEALGEPFTLDGRLTTPNQAATGGRIGLSLRANIVATRVTVAGTLPSATRIDGAPLKVSITGRNLQDPSRLFGIILPASRPYALAGTLTKTGQDYRLTGMTGRIGDSDISGRLTARVPARDGDRPRLDAVLASRSLAIKDVGPLVGYDPTRLDTPGARPTGRVVAGTPRLLPDAPLAIDQIKAFDAHVDYRADRVVAGKVPITNLHLGVTLDRSLLRLDPIATDLVGGRFTGHVEIDARQPQVVTDYDLALSQVRLGRLLTTGGLEDNGTTASVRGRIRMRGTGNSVATSLASADGRIALVFPQGTLWVRNIELAKLDIQNFVTHFLGKRLKKPTEIRCGILAFSVRGGKAVADPIVFDTSRATYRGAGGFDFGDESLGLSVEGKSKEISLFSGQSPIGIGGHFAGPRLNLLSGELVGRSAAAVALGVVASPIAALLAFVDPAGAKDVNCAPVLDARRDTPQSRAANARPKA